MRVLRSKKILAVVGAVLVGGTLAAAGISSIWTQTVLSDGTNVHVRVIRTIASDFDSGWHMHPGPAIVQVQEGSFQITQGSCTPKTVGAGETFIEVPFLPVRAIAVGKISWTVTQFGSYENPLSTPVTTNPCP